MSKRRVRTLAVGWDVSSDDDISAAIVVRKNADGTFTIVQVERLARGERVVGLAGDMKLARRPNR